MDILGEIKDTRAYNFHSHTQFCDGRAPMSEMARMAVEKGIEVYGFSPHSPVPIVSPCNMSFESVDEYISEGRKLQELYADKCRFFVGMEIDYLGNEWCPHHEYFQSLPLDFRIGSVHFIPSKQGVMTDIDGSYERFRENMKNVFEEDIRYVVDTFFSQTLNMVASGGFDIIGHLDKIAMNASLYHPGIEDEKYYKDYIGQLIDAIESRGLIVELNTKHFERKGRFYPGESVLKEFMKRNVPIIVNSDAHTPGGINASRPEAFELLDKIQRAL